MPTLVPRVAERINHRGGVFWGGEQQMLAMARADGAAARLICMGRTDHGSIAALCRQGARGDRRDQSRRVTVFMVE
jgi:ABC-type branched-subunit amino acid transport system ATPase component